MEGLLHIHEQVYNCIDAGLYQDTDRVWRLFREIVEGLLHIHEQVNNCIDAGLYQDTDRVWRLFREIVEGLLHIHEQVYNCIDAGLYQDTAYVTLCSISSGSSLFAKGVFSLHRFIIYMALTFAFRAQLTGHKFQTILHFFLRRLSLFANSADPHEIQYYAALHHCLRKTKSIFREINAIFLGFYNTVKSGCGILSGSSLLTKVRFPVYKWLILMHLLL